VEKSCIERRTTKNQPPGWLSNILDVCDPHENASLVIKFQNHREVYAETTINGNSLSWPDDIAKLQKRYPHMDIFLRINQSEVAIEKVVIKSKIKEGKAKKE